MISTHVLNMATGRPVPGVPVNLAVQHGETWEEIAETITDSDGRARNLGSAGMRPGIYRLTFDVNTTFYPRVEIIFSLTDSEALCHLPLLLSDYGYTTYRGS